ncbi:transcription-repair coupling factor [Pyruvatibacter sp.]|uniref:transcription-repair coupling factor n=1 Tax=Pyruvatibacter sp. TaxID=1981328 RepID=UPI0032EEB050
MTAADSRFVSDRQHLSVGGVPEGFDAIALGDLARARNALVVHIARDEPRLARLKEGLRFFSPTLPVIELPGWDCLPYDRVSPNSDVVARRMAALAELAARSADAGPAVLIATVNAALQRMPSRTVMANTSWCAETGDRIDMDGLLSFLARDGYLRSGTVREQGEFAVRGGIVDIFPPGFAEPVRLDLFGDTLEAIRTFDPETQLTTGALSRVDLVPATEIMLDEDTIRRFRAGYVQQFGTVTGEDPLYEAVSEGRRHQGMEHWLPLFHDEMATLFDYAGDGTIITLDPLAEEAAGERCEMISDYYAARAEDAEAHAAVFKASKKKSAHAGFDTPAYKPMKPDALYLTLDEFKSSLSTLPVRALSQFDLPDAPDAIDMGARPGRDFAPERKTENANVFEALRGHINALKKSGKQPVIAAWSDGSAERMSHVLREHGIAPVVIANDWQETQKLDAGVVGLVVLGIETGFETPTLAVVAEQDILGDRLVRTRKARRAQNFLSEVSSLGQGDYVVHVDHGIGQFTSLETIEVQGAPHDCLLIVYAGGDKLYLPVENIELLSRYGSDDTDAQLDRLGGGAWQARKAKMKERIREIANQLIAVAAARALKSAEPVVPAAGLYDEFASRFPYEETEDQARAIGDVISDLAEHKPMDRLVCGDVGFGKTEVALRAAFAAAMSGKQVALVVPTTLLARQHTKTFVERFAGWPLKIAQLSRMVTPKDADATREAMASGDLDIVIGTHALLSKSIKFKDLGLLIVDEEQHFGVAHKEQLKQLKADVHVLTLTATPIPRTLQLALTGVRELSIIATPPVDRLAVRTFVTPFDPVVIREALLRERYRGGQSFYVCPRISDLAETEAFLKEYVPEVKTVVAHGQMPPGQLDDIMNAFYDGKYDVLLSTTIVESGLDIPTANTMVVHRADMFGLAQLYQLRGRVGRSKARAFAYLTVPPKRTLTVNAEKRLKVLQSLDSLGAGFNLASHDLDIRGAGNLLGDEQSGHIREVGYELYQHMLEEAVAQARAGGLDKDEGEWSPQISVGTAVLIPDTYVADLDVRMSLYRRLASLEEHQEIEGFAAELIDRFGHLPGEVKHLLEIVEIKRLCRAANVEKIDAGPKGCVISLRNNEFANPAGLVQFINRARGDAKLRPDHKIVVKHNWPDAEDRLKGTRAVMEELATLAEGGSGA